MAAIFAYRCRCCDKMFEGSPSVAYKRPDTWLQQSEAVQKAGACSDDFCQYTNEDGSFYFIRTCLEVPIIGVEEPFLWGVWVSLSKTNFDRYWDTYDEVDVSDAYFGYLCNALPAYPDTHGMSATVRPQADQQRPLLELHEREHPLFADFRDGITVAQAQAIAEKIVRH